MAEGSMWEALDKAAYYKLGNLTAIIDVNRLGQRGPTELEWDMDAYRRRAEAFGCTAVIIDGHDITQIDQALATARGAERPVVVLAQTVKGRGFAEVEDKNGWHGRPLPADMTQRAVAGLGGQRDLRVITPRPDRHDAPPRPAAAATISCAWPGFPGRTSRCAARTPGWRSGRTARPGWRWRTLPRSVPSTAPPSCTRPTPPRPPP
jgi:transketolase